MPRHYRKTLLGLGTLVLAGAFTASAIPAFASSFPVTDARTLSRTSTSRQDSSRRTSPWSPTGTRT